jgi:hypothetical protein
VPGVIRPDELASLVDLAERPRRDDWSLRAALVRYAQPEPVRVARLLELVRRVEFALDAQRRTLESEGPAIWAAVEDPSGRGGALVGLLRAIRELDRLGDVLALWATSPAGDRPDAEVDRVIDAVTRHLDDLGIPHEPREPPPGSRRRG